MELVTLFYIVDEFCKKFEPEWRSKQIESGERVRNKQGAMTLSELMTDYLYLVSCQWLPSVQEILPRTYLHASG